MEITNVMEINQLKARNKYLAGACEMQQEQITELRELASVLREGLSLSSELNEYEKAVINYMRQGAQIDVTFFSVATPEDAFEKVVQFPESGERSYTDCTDGENPHFVSFQASKNKVRLSCIVSVKRKENK